MMSALLAVFICGQAAFAASAARNAATNTRGSVHDLMNGAVAGARKVLNRPRLVGVRGFFPSLPRGASERWAIAFHEPETARDYCANFLDGHEESVRYCDEAFRYDRASHGSRPIAVMFVDNLQIAGALARLGVKPNSKGQYWAWLFQATEGIQDSPQGMGGFLLGNPFPRELRGKAIWGVNNDDEVLFFDAAGGALLLRMGEARRKRR